MYTLMLENNPVIAFDFDEMITHIYNADLLPFLLRGCIKEPDNENPKEYYKISAANISMIREYASSRVLSLNRDNAKQIYTAFGLSQDNSISSRVSICLKCKGVSINDSYWFRDGESRDTWNSVDMRKNHLSEIIDVALGGSQPTLTTSPLSPELTTKGLFKKAWIREDGELYLLKSDRTSDFINTKVELLSSKILDCTNIPHVSYSECHYKDMLIAKSKNFALSGKSFVEAHEIIKYCKDKGLDYQKEMLHKFGSSFANIGVVDYIIQNTDRHDQNYGFFMDNNTGELESVAPLFDQNQSLIADLLNKDVSDTLSQMFLDNRTIKKVAMDLQPYADIIFYCDRWNELKNYAPEYQSLFKRIETRIESLSCIKYINKSFQNNEESEIETEEER